MKATKKLVTIETLVATAIILTIALVFTLTIALGNAKYLLM